MRNRSALFYNEMVKIWHKPISIILLALMLVSVLVGAVGAKAISSVKIYDGMGDDPEYLESAYKSERDNLRWMIEDLEKRDSDDPELPEDVEASKAYYNGQFPALDEMEHLGVNPWGYGSVVVDAYHTYLEAMGENAKYKFLYERDKNAEDLTIAEQYAKIAEKAKEAVEKQDPILYFEAQLLPHNDREDFESENEIMRLQIKGLQQGGTYTQVCQLGGSITELQNQINDGMRWDVMGARPLQTKERKAMENQIALAKYRLEHGIFEQSVMEELKSMGVSASPFALLLNVGKYFVLLLVAVLAGSAISDELATGSIKSMIIAPVSRKKIVTAKYTAVLCVGFGALVLLTLFAMPVSAIAFGKESLSAYLYVSGGTVKALPFPLYALLMLVQTFLGVAAVAAFGLMLSAYTKKTAIAVALSALAGVSGLLVTKVANFVFTTDYTRFLPWGNYELLDRIFGNASTEISVLFSLIYIAVLMVCLLWTAYDAFCRKDLT